ncbi:MAG: N-acetylmuramoyl-L-alanine amidase, partial [Pseudomonadota bacterium]
MLIRFAFVLLILLSGALFGVSDAGAGNVRVQDVRFGAAGDRTRVVVEADQPLKYEYFTLADGALRVVVDLPRVRWSIGGLTAESGSGQGQGVVAGYRFAHRTPETSRLVLDLSSPAIVSKHFTLPPASTAPAHRLVLDLEKVPMSAFNANATAPKPKASPRKLAKRKPMIVIDPGHGGKDPGAKGVRGALEKDVNLAAAKALADALRRTGRYEVALTRGTDIFLELQERVEKARDFEADLFISLHADAGSKPATRGASVYTLSASGEQRAEKMRERQDWVLSVETDETRSPEVNGILVDLIQRETKNQSAQFALALIPALKKANWPALTNTHRNAGFFVLLAPDVPAVLLEMGFMTNVHDEALLTSERHRRRLV